MIVTLNFSTLLFPPFLLPSFLSPSGHPRRAALWLQHTDSLVVARGLVVAARGLGRSVVRGILVPGPGIEPVCVPCIAR